jgi:hypothetical protein
VRFETDLNGIESPVREGPRRTGNDEECFQVKAVYFPNLETESNFQIEEFFINFA